MKQLRKAAALLLTMSLILGVAPTVYADVADEGTNISVETAYDISSGEVVTSRMKEVPGKYYYVFTAKESGYVNFLFERSESNTSTEKSIWVISVYDARMNLLATTYEHALSWGKSNFEYGTITVQEGDIYYMVVSSSNPFYTSTNVYYDIQVDFTAAPYVEKESNDSIKTANNLKLKKKYIGCMSSSKDVDYYMVKADKSGIYTIAFDRESFDSTVAASWNYTMYDAKMNELYSINTQVNSDGISCSYVLKKGQKVYLKISEKSKSTGILYHVKATFKAAENIELEPNNDYSSATKIKKLGTAYVGVLAEKKTSDYFVYTPDAAGTYKVSFKLNEDITYAYRVTVYDSSKKKVAESEKIYLEGSVKFTAKKGQKYYVVVSHADNTGCYYGVPYKLTVKK